MSQRDGFTLIELLVVIAIIAVLMGILMPSLQKAKEQAQTAVCQGNLKGYTLALAMYAQDNSEKFLNSNKVYFRTSDKLPGETAEGTYTHIHQRWYNSQVNLRNHPEYGSEFFGYLANVKALICPTFKKLARAKGANLSKEIKWLGQQDDRFYDPWHNYTMNAYLGPGGVISKRTQLKRPADVFVFADEGPYSVTGINANGLNDTSLWPIMGESNWNGALKQFGNKENVKPGPNGYGAFVDIIGGFHHSPTGDPTAGKGNCTFADGHVAPVNREDTFSVAWPK